MPRVKQGFNVELAQNPRQNMEICLLIVKGGKNAVNSTFKLVKVA